MTVIYRLDVEMVDWDEIGELVKLAAVAGKQELGDSFAACMKEAVECGWNFLESMPAYQRILVCSSILAAFAIAIKPKADETVTVQ